MKKKELHEEELKLQREFDELGKHLEMTDVEYTLPAFIEVLEKDKQESSDIPMEDFTQRRKDAKRKDHE